MLEKYLRGAWPAERRLAMLNLIRELATRLNGGYQAVFAVHAEGSIEAEKMAMLRFTIRSGLRVWRCDWRGSCLTRTNEAYIASPSALPAVRAPSITIFRQHASDDFPAGVGPQSCGGCCCQYQLPPADHHSLSYFRMAVRSGRTIHDG